MIRTVCTLFSVLFLGSMTFWSGGCGAVAEASGDQQALVENTGQEQDSPPSDEQGLTTESSAKGGYGEEEEFETSVNDLVAVDNENDGDGNEIAQRWVYALPLEIDYRTNGNLQCGYTSQYVPYEGFEVFSLILDGGAFPDDTADYWVRWIFQDGSIESGRLSEVRAMRVSLAEEGIIQVFVSDDIKAKSEDEIAEWQQLTLAEISYENWGWGGKG